MTDFVLQPGHQIVRGKVYDIETSRYLGTVQQYAEAQQNPPPPGRPRKPDLPTPEGEPLTVEEVGTAVIVEEETAGEVSVSSEEDTRRFAVEVNKDDLVALAREEGLSGYSKMTADELREAFIDTGVLRDGTPETG